MGARIHYWAALFIAVCLWLPGCATPPDRVCLDGYHDMRTKMIPMRGMGWVQTQEPYWHCTDWEVADGPAEG